MKKLRTLICAVLSLMIMATVCSAAPSQPAIDAEEEIPIECTTSAPEIVPFASSYLILDSPVTSAGLSWTQPAGYGSYRMWVKNTGKSALKVTVTYKKNILFNTSYTKTISAGGQLQWTVNNAKAVKHSIAFSSSTGDVSGIVRVRVSDTAL